MIAFVYDALFGYIKSFFFDVICSYLKGRGEPVRAYNGFVVLRRLRVRHLEYWHPN